MADKKRDIEKMQADIAAKAEKQKEINKLKQ